MYIAIIAWLGIYLTYFYLDNTQAEHQGPWASCLNARALDCSIVQHHIYTEAYRVASQV